MAKEGNHSLSFPSLLCSDMFESSANNNLLFLPISGEISMPRYRGKNLDKASFSAGTHHFGSLPKKRTLDSLRRCTGSREFFSCTLRCMRQQTEKGIQYSPLSSFVISSAASAERGEPTTIFSVACAAREKREERERGSSNTFPPSLSPHSRLLEGSPKLGERGGGGGWFCCCLLHGLTLWLLPEQEEEGEELPPKPRNGRN